MSVKVILENAKAQLEAQKSKIYDEAKTTMIARLKPEYDTYVAQKKAERDEAIRTVTVAYENAIAEKRSSDEATACSYANAQTQAVVMSIERLNSMINDTEGV